MSSTDPSRNQLRKGLVLLAVGGWLLLNTVGPFDLAGGWFLINTGPFYLAYHNSWPILMILIGLAITIAPNEKELRRGVRPGIFLIAWGVLAWIAERGLWGFSWSTVWPLFLVCAGLAIAWGAIAEQRRVASTSDQGRNE
jgi:hypothetical protein